MNINLFEVLYKCVLSEALRIQPGFAPLNTKKYQYEIHLSTLDPQTVFALFTVKSKRLSEINAAHILCILIIWYAKNRIKYNYFYFYFLVGSRWQPVFHCLFWPGLGALMTMSCLCCRLYLWERVSKVLSKYWLNAE